MSGQTHGPITFRPRSLWTDARGIPNKYGPTSGFTLSVENHFSGDNCERCGLPLRVVKSLQQKTTSVRFCRDCRGGRHNVKNVKKR